MNVDYAGVMRTTYDSRQLFDVLHRFAYLVAWFLVLNVPHIGMVAPASASTMMTHAMASDDPMSGIPAGHGLMKGALCAAICLGTDQFNLGAVVARSERFVVARWIRPVDPDWTPPTPDPALRPPDMPRPA